MEFTIKSRKLGTTFEFFKNHSDKKPAYIYLETTGAPGTLGNQICEGGGFLGSTLSANDSNFEYVCRRWYRQYMKSQEI